MKDILIFLLGIALTGSACLWAFSWYLENVNRR
jgi:hypothetical protein